MSKRYLPAITAAVRQFLRDEFVDVDTEMEFANDELEMQVNNCLIEVSQVRPYEAKETVESDGTREVDLTDTDIAGDLIGERVVKAEYPTGAEPPTFQDFTIFGDTLRFTNVTPTSGEDIYLYCHEVHQLTVSSSTLSPDLEKVLIDGVVARAALTFLNKNRSQIVPATIQLYQQWAALKLAEYQAGLRGITKPNVWQF